MCEILSLVVFLHYAVYVSLHERNVSAAQVEVLSHWLRVNDKRFNEITFKIMYFQKNSKTVRGTTA